MAFSWWSGSGSSAWAEHQAETRRITELLQRLDTLLIVRDPGAAHSAAAYDGLRKQIATLASDRRRHLVQLARLSTAVASGASAEELGKLLAELREEEGLVETYDTSAFPEVFVMLADPGNSTAKATLPAYLAGVGDEGVPRVIKQGTAEWVENDEEAQDSDEPIPPRQSEDEGSSKDSFLDIEASGEEEQESPLGEGESQKSGEETSK